MSKNEAWNASTDHILRPTTGAQENDEDNHYVEQSYAGKKKAGEKRKFFIVAALILALLAIGGAVVGVLIAKKVIKIDGSGSSTSAVGSGTGSDSGSTTTAATTSNPTKCSTADEISSEAKGTWQDPTSWLDGNDFNCTYTDEKIGDLPLIGLNSSWDDSKQANPNVPPLNKPWGSYKDRPFRGVSLGGWLSLEPFITPSLFDVNPKYRDEYTLCEGLGPQEAAKVLEKHYATFITENDFKAIANAGLDHIRIPFSYWAVKTFQGDPYVPEISWRYLLRGIEWARKYGLRIKLDLHGAPGSQNGWNHSGRDGKMEWLTGPNGSLNAQRTLDIHKQMSKFFAQDRYKNVIAFYGHLNEPALSLPQDDLINWTTEAYKIVKGNGFSNIQVFSESMRGLTPWAGKLTGYRDSLAIDVHLYTIFDDNLAKMKHTERVKFACSVYTDQVSTAMSTGFGPTMVGEWSQAGTDCTKHLNGVNNGARWTGTFSGTSSPKCPTLDSQCNCDMANANATSFSSDYKVFLKTFAEAQMSAFEKSWGWFYWTWKTETAPLWSYQAALEGKFMPEKAYTRDWDCSKPIPSFGNLPEYY